MIDLSMEIQQEYQVNNALGLSSRSRNACYFSLYRDRNLSQAYYIECQTNTITVCFLKGFQEADCDRKQIASREAYFDHGKLVFFGFTCQNQ